MGKTTYKDEVYPIQNTNLIASGTFTEQTQITISNIPQSFNTLRLVVMPTATSGTNRSLAFWWNDNEGNNYAFTIAPTDSTYSVNNGRGPYGAYIRAGIFETNTTSQMVIEIPNYATPGVIKTCSILSGNTNTDYQGSRFTVGTQVTITNPITSLNFGTDSYGYYMNGSYALYGVK